MSAFSLGASRRIFPSKDIPATLAQAKAVVPGVRGRLGAAEGAAPVRTPVIRSLHARFPALTPLRTALVGTR